MEEKENPNSVLEQRREFLDDFIEFLALLFQEVSLRRNSALFFVVYSGNRAATASKGTNKGYIQ